MNEIWKDVVGYEGLYQVSNMGRVKRINFKNERIIKPSYRGLYLGVSLCKNGKSKTCSVHRLVGIAFISNPNNNPQINHIDGNKANNRSDNLEWCTSEENINHSIIKNLRNSPKGETHHKCKLTKEQVLEIRAKYIKNKYGFRKLAKDYNVGMGYICEIIQRKTWKHI